LYPLPLGMRALPCPPLSPPPRSSAVSLGCPHWKQALRWGLFVPNPQRQAHSPSRCREADPMRPPPRPPPKLRKPNCAPPASAPSKSDSRSWRAACASAAPPPAPPPPPRRRIPRKGAEWWLRSRARAASRRTIMRASALARLARLCQAGSPGPLVVGEAGSLPRKNRKRWRQPPPGSGDHAARQLRRRRVALAQGRRAAGAGSQVSRPAAPRRTRPPSRAPPPSLPRLEDYPQAGSTL
jgi:hypothetical protein